MVRSHLRLPRIALCSRQRSVICDGWAPRCVRDPGGFIGGWSVQNGSQVKNHLIGRLTALGLGCVKTPKWIMVLNSFEKLAWRHGKRGCKPLLNEACPSKVCPGLPRSHPKFMHMPCVRIKGDVRKADILLSFNPVLPSVFWLAGKRNTCWKDLPLWCFGFGAPTIPCNLMHASPIPSPLCTLLEENLAGQKIFSKHAAEAFGVVLLAS